MLHTRKSWALLCFIVEMTVSLPSTEPDPERGGLALLIAHLQLPSTKSMESRSFGAAQANFQARLESVARRRATSPGGGRAVRRCAPQEQFGLQSLGLALLRPGTQVLRRPAFGETVSNGNRRYRLSAANSDRLRLDGLERRRRMAADS